MKKKKIKFNIIENPKSLSTSFVINLKDLSANKQSKKSKYNLFSKKSLKVNFASKIKNHFRFFKFKTRLNRRKIWSNKLKSFSQAIRSDRKNQRQEISWYKSIISFLLILIFLVVPFKFLSYLKVIDFSAIENKIFSHSQAAFENLFLASNSVKSLNLEEASDKFSLASGDFQKASLELDKFNNLLLNLARYSNDPKLKAASFAPLFLEAGKGTANLGKYLSLAFESILNDDYQWQDKIEKFFSYNNLALNEANLLVHTLNKIDYNVIPLEQRENYFFYQKTALDIRKSLQSLADLEETFYAILGFNEKKRYLLVFQNNYELRASGGFMGSFALLDILRSEIVNLEVPSGGTYDTEAGMTSFIESPSALHLVSPRWYFWDSNWWPDWPTSALNIMYMYEKSSGPSVDGVFAFNMPVLESLLELTGPIDLGSDYNLVIDKENFWTLIQKTVEKKNVINNHSELLEDIPDSLDNEPKQIIADLMSEILNRLPESLNFDSFAFLLESFDRHLKSKDILLYFNDEKIQDKIRSLGVSAELAQTDYDYLMIVDTNIAGQKTDKVMEEKVFLDTTIFKDGTIVNELTIAKKHTAFKNEIFTGVRNVNWLRIYVPEGSQLISATGFHQPDKSYFSYPEEDWEKHPLVLNSEGRAVVDDKSQTLVYQELNKTVFANWTMTDPQQYSVIRIKYQLPFKFSPLSEASNFLDRFKSNQKKDSYFHSLILQKQAGKKDFNFYARLRLAGDWQLDWSYPKNINSETYIWSIDELINQDKIWAFNVSKY